MTCNAGRVELIDKEKARLPSAGNITALGVFYSHLLSFLDDNLDEDLLDSDSGTICLR